MLLCSFTGYHHLPPSLTVLLNYVFCFCFVLFLIPFTGCYVASGKGAGHFFNYKIKKNKKKNLDRL